MGQATEFQGIYGMRFIGLEDPDNAVKGLYTFPHAEAPFPRDVVIDRDGIVRYWSTEYDPQKILRAITSSLDPLAGIDGSEIDRSPTIRWLPAIPNPSSREVLLNWISTRPVRALALHDARGRQIRRLEISRETGSQQLRWDGRDRLGRLVPSGVYYVRVADTIGIVPQRIVRIR